MSKRVECGIIAFEGKEFSVELNKNDLSVWVTDEQKSSSHIGYSSSKNETDVLDLAKQILKNKFL